MMETDDPGTTFLLDESDRDAVLYIGMTNDDPSVRMNVTSSSDLLTEATPTVETTWDELTSIEDHVFPPSTETSHLSSSTFS